MMSRDEMLRRCNGDKLLGEVVSLRLKIAG